MPSPSASSVGPLQGLLDPLYGFVRQRRRDTSSDAPAGPWMKHMEIEIVEEVLTRLRPKRCLEWGAGYSTLHFPALLPDGASWLAVEHNAEWAAKIGGLSRRDDVAVHHVAPNHTPWSDPARDGTYEDLTDYVEHPGDYAPFDFVLVDGRARASCLRKALTLLSDRGVVLLHDAHRRQYHEALTPYAHQELFCMRYRARWRLRRRSRGLWIGSMGLPIDAVLDVERHRRIWSVWNILASVAEII